MRRGNRRVGDHELRADGAPRDRGSATARGASSVRSAMTTSSSCSSAGGRSRSRAALTSIARSCRECVAACDAQLRVYDLAAQGADDGCSYAAGHRRLHPRRHLRSRSLAHSSTSRRWRSATTSSFPPGPRSRAGGAKRTCPPSRRQLRSSATARSGSPHSSTATPTRLARWRVHTHSTRSSDGCISPATQEHLRLTPPTRASARDGCLTPCPPRPIPKSWRPWPSTD